jgi:hypothetical protein
VALLAHNGPLAHTSHVKCSRELVPTADINLVVSLMQMLFSLLDEWRAADAAQAQVIVDTMPAQARADLQRPAKSNRALHISEPPFESESTPCVAHDGVLLSPGCCRGYNQVKLFNVNACLDSLFVFSLVWSVGASCDRPSAHKLDAFLRQLLAGKVQAAVDRTDYDLGPGMAIKYPQQLYAVALPEVSSCVQVLQDCW